MPLSRLPPYDAPASGSGLALEARSRRQNAGAEAMKGRAFSARSPGSRDERPPGYCLLGTGVGLGAGAALASDLPAGDLLGASALDFWGSATVVLMRFKTSSVRSTTSSA